MGQYRMRQGVVLLMGVMSMAAHGAEWTFPVRGDHDPDAAWIVSELSSGHQERPGARFVDGHGTLTYGFSVAGLSHLVFTLRLGNNFQVQVSTDGRRWAEVLNAMRIHGRDRHDGEVNPYRVDVSHVLPAAALYLRFRDASRDDGWGAYITEIGIVSDAPAEHRWHLPAEVAGVIREWLVLGPFTAADDPAAAVDGAGVPCLEPAPRQDAALATRRWRRLAVEGDRVDLAGLGDTQNRVAYAHAYVHAPALAEAELRLGSDDGVRAWLNGAEVWRHDVHRGCRVDDDVVPVLLGQGWNRLLLRIANGVGAWQFTARIVASGGEPIPGLHAQAAHPRPAGRLPVPNVPPRVDLVQAALRGEDCVVEKEGLRAHLRLAFRNLGATAADELRVELIHGDRTVTSWALATVPAGLSDTLLALPGAVCDEVFLDRPRALSVRSGPRTVPVAVSEPRGLLVDALGGDTVSSVDVDVRDAVEGLADLPRRWAFAKTPSRRRRAFVRKVLSTALRGRWGELRAMVAGAVAQCPDHGAKPWRTAFQCAAPYDLSFDVRPDAVMVYGLADTARRVREWRRHGYRTQLMTGIAWGHYQDYLYGRFDGQNHEDDAQQDGRGNRITHGGDVYYMVPTEPYTEYLCRYIEKSFALPLDGICLEEPEFWMRGGWSPAFRREWEQYYGEPWRPPDSSYEACYRAAMLKKELYRRCLQTVCDYVKAHRPEWECMVATHSLINYANWGIASPESALATVASCDTVIAQVWTDTIRTPCTYDGVRAVRPFANAYLEFAQMVAMVTPTGQSLAFLADPVADNQGFDWDTCRRSYEHTVVAGLFCPEVNRYEVMPWPDRVFRQRRVRVTADGIEEKVTIPPDYARQVLSTIHALQHMPVGSDGEGARPVGIAVADSMMYQRGTVRGQAAGFDNFFGLALPLVYRGVMPRLLHLEHVHGPEDIDVDVVLLTYNGQKPPSAAVHRHLAAWVASGGVLAFFGDGRDPFQTVREWWNSDAYNYALAQDHLFAALGLPASPAQGWHAVGRGHVFVGRQAPATYTLEGRHALLGPVLESAWTRAGVTTPYRETPTAHICRGPYLAATNLADPASAPVRIGRGAFVNLFDAALAGVEEARLPGGRSGLWVDLERLPAPAVAASTSRVIGLATSDRHLEFTACAPAGVTIVTCLRLPARPPRIQVTDARGVALDTESSWDDVTGALWLTYPAQPGGTDVMVSW